MAGTISLSLSYQPDALGNPLAGGLLKFYQAGTVGTPQNAYQDAALTILHPNPIVLNAAGRVPQFYLADGSIKVVLTDHLGAVQLSADNILVVGPSGGGGGGGGVDPTTVLQTGWLQAIYGTGIIAGFVRCNGRTIGSATSGATERANSDCQALFTFLWNADALLPVSGGRGVSAIADWGANKTIGLPDCRGKALAALADMGSTDSGTYTGATFDRGSATQLGSILGRSRRTLLTANLPPYTPAGTLSLSTSVATSVSTGVTGTATVASLNWVASNSGDSTAVSAGGAGSAYAVSTSGGPTVSKITSAGAISASATSSAVSTATPTGTFTGTAVSGQISAAFDTISPYLLVTIYIKL